MKQITERDKELLRFVQTFIDEHGYSPSLREIGNGCFMSKPTAYRHIMRLVELGYMQVTPKCARSYVVKIVI